MTICFDVFSLIVKSCNEVPLVCVWQIAKASVFPKLFGTISHGALVKIVHHNQMIPFLDHRRCIWVFWRALSRTGNKNASLMFPQVWARPGFPEHEGSWWNFSRKSPVNYVFIIPNEQYESIW